MGYQESERTDKIKAALVLAQTETQHGAVKTKKNTHLRNAYATLEDNLAVATPALNTTEILLSQGAGDIIQRGNETVVTYWQVVFTRLDHPTSGQWMLSTIEIPIDKPSAHAVGSALTYGRRYTLNALLAIPSVDDDGNAAVGKESPLVKKSAHRMRKDGGDDLYREIERHFREAKTIESLQMLGKTYADDIDQMPQALQEKLREQYDETRMGLSS